MIGMRTERPANDNSSEVRSAPRFDDFEMRLGDVMRGERATLGKSLLDVQRELRIRASYVAAIENCDVSAFDAPSFIAGYVRSYAKYLGMDPDWTFRHFCEESGFQPVHGMAPAASGPKPQRRPADPAEALANPKALFIPQPESFWSGIEPRAIGSIAVMVALAVGLGYGGWSVLQEVQKVRLTPSDQSPGIVAALDPVQEMQAPELSQDLAAIDLPQPEALDRIYRPQALEVPVMTPRDGPIAAIDPGLPDPMEEAIQTALAATPAPDAAAMAHGPQLPAGQDQAVRTVAADAAELELLAVRPAWVRVSSADGTVILEKTMDAGERFTLPKLEQPPVLRAGNSGAVYFAVSGQTYGPAAPGAQVVKNIELSPAALTERFAAADLTSDPELAQMVALASAAPLIGEPEEAGAGGAAPPTPRPGG
ncbi:helix-turn-helix domain-containing protein [Paracoccus sp. Z118]|uniref:helix-turn-helix domain-containing protein n=1 Tax=Paracoccus sp. Z118 TaxID=2851017 RepID=UPI001C2CC36E|nr:helix-turn-helix domain-containing protein [Paracoccus sp. Z118]MBV0890284.1 helix-turn-helix domain-containing protein [Paracoccus sp. Z118]